MHIITIIKKIIFRMAHHVDTSPYTIAYRIQAAAWLYETDRSNKAMREVKDKLRANYDVEPPRGVQILAWMEKLFRTGSIFDLNRTGRPNKRGDVADDVNLSLEQDPKLSTRRRSEEMGIPRSTLMKVMKKDLGYKPFKSVKVQYLSNEDHISRVELCQQILNRYDNPRRKQQLLFTDECAIYGDGKNVNSVFWSRQNPHFWEQVNQHPPIVMVWAGMSAQNVIGPFFIEERISANVYLQMLRTQLVPRLHELGILYSAHFQQDGAPAHTAHITREYLNEIFPNRWVGKFGPIGWPARSPDLSSCDNALWGLVKPSIMAQKCRTVDELKNVITNEFAKIGKETLEKIHNRTFRRLQLCIDHQGLQVDPFDN